MHGVRHGSEVGRQHGDFGSLAAASGPVEWARLRRYVAVSPAEVFQRSRESHGLGGDDEMVPSVSGEGAPGFEFTRFRQHHRSCRCSAHVKRVGGAVLCR